MTLALCTDDCPAWLAPFAALDLAVMFSELMQRPRSPRFLKNEFPTLFEVLGEQLLVLDQLASELPDVDLDHVRQLALVEAIEETWHAPPGDTIPVTPYGRRHSAFMAKGEAGNFAWPLFLETREGKTEASQLLADVTTVALAQWRLRVGPRPKGYVGSDIPVPVFLQKVSNPVLYGKLLAMIACSNGQLELAK